MKQSRIIIFTYISLITSIFGHHSHASDFDSLTIMTENYPPFNFQKNGKVAGTAVDLLVKASTEVGDPIANRKINLITWARAYRTILNKPKHMLFSMTRTAEREDLFKWAGPIGENRIVIFAKKSSKIEPFNTIADLSENIGVVRDTVGDQLMVSAGAKDDIMIRNSKPEDAAKMLMNNRVKLWVYSEVSGQQQLEALGENIDQYRVVHVLETTKLYFAFSKDVDDKLIAKLQKGIDKVR